MYMKKDIRMKKYICMLALSILLMSGVCSASSVDVGKTIFDEKCRFCHGGNPPSVASDAQSISALSEDAKVREESVSYIVRNGTKDGMPSFSKDNISDVDIEYLVAYLKSVPNSFDPMETATKGPEATPVETIQNGKSVATPKTPGFRIIFCGMIVLTVYVIRRDYKKR